MLVRKVCSDGLREEVDMYFTPKMIPTTKSSYKRRWDTVFQNKRIFGDFLLRDDVLEADDECDDPDELTIPKLECIMDNYTEELIEKFRDEYENKHSLRTNFQGMLKIASDYEYCVIADETLQLLRDAFQTIMMEERAYAATKTLRETLPYDKIKELVAEQFGSISQEYLLILLYEQVHARDDFGKIIIVKSMDLTDPDFKQHTKNGKDKQASYIVWPDLQGDDATLHLNYYKTHRNYGSKRFKLRPYIVSLMRQLGIKHGQYLIANPSDPSRLKPVDRSLKLNKYLNKILSKSSIGKNYLKGGPINFLRHSIITQRANDAPDSIDHRMDVSNHAFHSPTTTLTYQRKVVDN